MRGTVDVNRGAGDPIWEYVRNQASATAPDSDIRLPTEREFSELFSLPRSAVRRSLLRLERQGLVVRHVGRGTFVQSKNFTTPASHGEANLPDASPVQLIAARIALEPPIAMEAAQNAVGADFRELSAAIEDSVSAVNLKQYETADERFHLGLAAATHNTILIGSMRLIIDARLNASWGRLKEVSRVLDPDRRAAVRDEHLAILDTVMSRDGELASRRMMDHLQGVRARLFGGPPKSG